VPLDGDGKLIPPRDLVQVEPGLLALSCNEVEVLVFYPCPKDLIKSVPQIALRLSSVESHLKSDTHQRPFPELL